MNEALIEIHAVTKAFDSKAPPALHAIEATISKGEIVGLVGSDGAGKTTLIRLMAGLLLPTGGYITIAGKNTIEEAEAVHALTGYMPQKFGLYEDLTVLQNLTLYADLRGVTENRGAIFDQLLTFTGLAPFVDRLAKNLSGGMKQKLGLACALLKKPTLLLLDEPTVGVDPLSRRELWKMVSSLVDEGISVIWSTAYLEEAERCNTVLLLHEGKILFYGKPEELTKRVEGRVFKISHIEGNRRQMLANVLQDANVIDGTIQGSSIRLLMKDHGTLPERTNPTPPRFEDAFIDILGGFTQHESKLAKIFPLSEEKSDIAVQADQLTKKFGSFTAVDHVSFSVKRGTIFGLLGPNGAGKTTTFRMMCGLLRPTSGKATVAGLDQQEAPSQARAKIGYMAQKFSLYGQLTVTQNLAFFSKIYNLTGKEQEEAISKMIEIFYLKEYQHTSADLLPLGFKRRLALACATMHHPAVLFLDEPTSGVDPLTRREFWNHINSLVEKGVTVMVTTHFMDEADYCDQVALIYSGKIINLDTPDALKMAAKSPSHPEPTLEDAFIKLIEDYERKTTPVKSPHY